MSQWLTYPVMSIPTKHTEPSKKNMQPTSVEFMPAASLACGSNMDSMKPTPQKFMTLSMYGMQIDGLCMKELLKGTKAEKSYFTFRMSITLNEDEDSCV